MTKRFQFVTEEFQPHRPGTRRGINVENPAAQGDLAFLGHLRFRFVALFFEPFHEVERVEALAADEDARSFPEFLRRERALQQRGDTGDDERRGWRVAVRDARQRDQRFQPFADDIGVRQLRFVRQTLPGGIEQGLKVGG